MRRRPLLPPSLLQVRVPRLSLRGGLLGARPFVGAVGASSLLLLACSWFAIGFGTLILLPRAGGARATVEIAPAGPSADTSAARPPTDQVRASRQLAPRRLRTPHATPARPGGAVTLDGPRTPPREGALEEPAADGGSPTAPAGPNPAPQAAPTAMGEMLEPQPPPSILDVAPLPAPPTLPAPPSPPALPLPDLSAATTGLGVP